MSSKRAMVQSILLHLGVIAVLIFSVDFAHQQITRPSSERNVVKAKVIDRSAIAAELAREKAAEERARQEAQRKNALAEKARKLEQQRREEEARASQRAVEQRRQAQERERAEQQAAAEKKAAEQKAAEQKAAEQKAAAEKAAEAERVRAKEAALAAERQRMEDALQAELAAEEAAIEAAERANAERLEISRYVAAIQARVRQSYTLLPGQDGLSCTLRISLIPGGEVAGVEIVKSSGNATFDRQAENAVRKASPLPVPAEPRLFQQMRSIQFVFDPKR